MQILETISDFLSSLFGSFNERMIRKLLPLVEEVKSLEPEVQSLSDRELRAKTEEFRNRLQNDETMDDILAEAFAVVREAAARTLGMRPYDVQVLGGIVLHQGRIAEMQTGEGKTLVATMPAYLNALKDPVHIVTVNDYLARRDAQWMGPVYNFLGLHVSAIQSEEDAKRFDPDHLNDPNEELRNLRDVGKKEAYQADIIYGTNNEFGFDYLRDHMKVDKEEQCVTGHNFAIIDEVDNILIDEARTPLIISGPADQSTEKYYEADRVARALNRGEHYEVEEKDNQCILTEEGIKRAQEIVGVDSFYTGQNMDWPHHIEQALRAHELYQRDQEYVVKDGEVIIVDEFTGRLREGRRWSDGLHQAVEAKENLDIRKENQTLATITLQNYFKMYDKLSGMTGTAATEAGEFDEIYDLEVVVIPTNKPLRRTERPDLLFRTEEDKFKAAAEQIEILQEEGRPVLVGTTDIDKSERLSRLLEKRGIEHDLLNAKQHEREAKIVAQAGQEGAVTIATNMAGRGTDIKLGDGIAEKGGLHVLGTERHEARRIDNQLRGRAGRQGDPGSSQFFISLEDELLRVFASDWVDSMMGSMGMDEGEGLDKGIESSMISSSVERAQTKKEDRNFQIRKELLDYDEVMNEQRKIIYDQRQDILEGEGLRDMVMDMIEDVTSDAVDQYLDEEEPKEDWDYEGLSDWVVRTYDLDVGVSEIEDQEPDKVFHTIMSRVEEAYREREERLEDDEMRRIEQFILLDRLDEKWKDHLYSMQQLRDAIGFRGYAQKDPKIEYKREGYAMFEDLMENVKEDVADLILKISVEVEDEEDALESRWSPTEFGQEEFNPVPDEDVDTTAAYEDANAEGGEEKPQPIKKDEKVGRNDPCPCGSGSKYKKCCGRGSRSRS
jgi:preprotein translocase subunit SecA